MEDGFIHHAYIFEALILCQNRCGLIVLEIRKSYHLAQRKTQLIAPLSAIKMPSTIITSATGLYSIHLNMVTE